MPEGLVLMSNFVREVYFALILCVQKNSAHVCRCPCVMHKCTCVNGFDQSAWCSSIDSRALCMYMKDIIGMLLPSYVYVTIIIAIKTQNKF